MLHTICSNERLRMLPGYPGGLEALINWHSLPARAGLLRRAQSPDSRGAQLITPYVLPEMAVGHDAPNEVIDGLRQRLLDGRSSLPVKYRALFALRNVSGRDAESAIVAGEHRVIWGTFDVLQEMQVCSKLLCISCIPCLAGLKDASALFRHEVAYCLGQRQDPAAIPTLMAVLRDPTEHAMYAMWPALTALHPSMGSPVEGLIMWQPSGAGCGMKPGRRWAP